MSVASRTHSYPPATLKKKWPVLHEHWPMTRDQHLCDLYQACPLSDTLPPCTLYPNYVKAFGVRTDSFLLPHRNGLFRTHSLLSCKIPGLRAQAANDMKEFTANAIVLPWRCHLFCYCLDPYQSRTSLRALQEPSSPLYSLAMFRELSVHTSAE